MDDLATLNDAQKTAVLHPSGPCMVIAGAGSGKTRVITHRIAHLIEQGTAPWNILAVTFTNKAAREMRERIETLLGSSAQDLWIGTFHAMLGRVLRREAEHLDYTSQFTIYDKIDSQSLIKQILGELKLDYPPPKVMYAISQAKTKLLSPKDYAAYEQKEHTSMPIAQVYTHYASRCKAANAMDFDDLLYNAYLLFSTHPEQLNSYQDRFKHILVDEFQDTNLCQYLIVRLLSQQHKNLYVVGDDAQSIYSFRGATIANVFEFQKDYPDHTMVRLEQNYRSSQTIVESSNALMQGSKQRIPKKLWTDNATGAPILLEQNMSEEEEGRFIASYLFENKHSHQIPYEDMAVLYRTHRQSRAIEDALRRLSIPYTIYGGLAFYERKEIKDIIAYLRFIVNGNDEIAFRRIINQPKRGLGDSSVSRILAVATEHNLSIWETIQAHQQYFNTRISNLLEPFRLLVEKCKDLAEQADAYEVTKQVVEDSKLISTLDGDENEQLARKENIEELFAALHSFVNRPFDPQSENRQDLAAFLQEAALATSADNTQDDSIRLMTVHSAKGLEFRSVVVAGVEEGFFPSGMAKNTAEQEEERRLFYVALTRAKERLVISYTLSRYQYGNRDMRQISRFVKSLPKEYIKAPGLDPWANQSSASNTLQNIRRQNLKRLPNAQGQDMSYTEGIDEYQIQEGTRVLHNMFGKGTIINTSGGQSPKVRIKFDNGEEKTLLLQYAKLSVID